MKTAPAVSAATIAAEQVSPMGADVSGLPADVRVRPLDLTSDLPLAAALIGDVNAFDKFDQFPSVDTMAIWLRPSALFEPASDAAVLEDDLGVVAIGLVERQVRDGKVIHFVDGWVRPDRRREGIGRAILRRAEGRSGELLAAGGLEHPGFPQFLGFGVLQSNPAAVAFADASGYDRIRFGFRMHRDLGEPIADVALPAGLELRPVRVEDHRRIWDADVEAFRDHWEHRERDESDFQVTFHGPDVETDLWRVAWEGDEVAGSVMNQIYPEENVRIGREIGWLEHVSVRRAWRGRGVASALIVSSMRVLQERGMTIAALGVDAENPTGALGVYERLGFRRHQTWMNYRKALEPAR